MNVQQEETVSVIRDLIETCRDGQEGFRAASESVADDPELKMLLSSFSLERAKFAGELESLLLGMGEHHPEREGSSVAGAAHRGWIKFKAAVTRADNHAILAECERGEDLAVESYNKALAHGLPEPIREVVQKQRQEVLTAHNTVRALRDATPGGVTRAASAAKSATQAVRAQTEKAAKSAAEVWEEMKSKAGDWRESTETYVRRNPLPSLGWALATGFAIGMLFQAAGIRNERARLEAERHPWRRFAAAFAAWLGVIGSRTRSGVRSSVETIQEKVEDLASQAPRQIRRGNRMAKPLRRMWNRMT
jgi:uncharacterized protein (TIGR02284 family)